MTLTVSVDGVKNTKGTEVTMGKSTIKVGRDLVNEDRMSLHQTDLEVGNDLIQRGDFRVDDPQVFANSVLEIVKTAGNVTEIGKKILDLLKKSS